MISVSIVSKNDIGKCIIKYSLLILVLFFVIRIFKYSNVHLVSKEISLDQGILYIAEEITSLGSSDTEDYMQIDSKDIIGGELRMSASVSSRNTDSLKQVDVGANENVEENSPDYEVNEDVSTELVQSKYKDNYNMEIDGVKIKNETGYNLMEMGISSDVKLDNRNVIIYHTHTCESYTPTEENSYDSSGNYRTTDLNYSVAKVGDVFDEYLSSFGFSVIHDKTYHDYPSYSGSYGRSLSTISELLQSCDKTDMLFDVHRDAIADESYAPKVKIGDEYAARIMFVIGTDGSGLDHPNWKNNLEFAIKVQKKADEMYPGLFKSIIVRNSRYNQHLGSNATIIEVGATGNTLEECEVSVKYLAKVLDKVVE